VAEHQGKILVARGMLVPAGKRHHRKGRLFVSAYILELAANREAINKAKDVLSWHLEQARAQKIRRDP
jgi:hypothetical protein